jgi:hypothetical protein
MCTIWTRLKQNKRIILASQPFFLYFISGGTILLALTIVPLAFDLKTTNENRMTIACNAAVWLAMLGTSIILSALFSKTHRIVTIMKAMPAYCNNDQRCRHPYGNCDDMYVLFLLTLLVSCFQRCELIRFADIFSSTFLSFV